MVKATKKIIKKFTKATHGHPLFIKILFENLTFFTQGNGITRSEDNVPSTGDYISTFMYGTVQGSADFDLEMVKYFYDLQLRPEQISS